MVAIAPLDLLGAHPGVIEGAATLGARSRAATAERAWMRRQEDDQSHAANIAARRQPSGRLAGDGFSQSRETGVERRTAVGASPSGTTSSSGIAATAVSGRRRGGDAVGSRLQQQDHSGARRN